MTLRAWMLRIALPVVAALLPMSLLSHVTASSASPETSFAAQTHQLVNSERAKRGVPAVGGNACLKGYAVAQAKRMAARGQIFHQSLGPVARTCGLSAWSENVGWTSGGTPGYVVAGWMRSSGHRATLLNRRYKLIGVGVARSADGTWYVSHVFGRKR